MKRIYVTTYQQLGTPPIPDPQPPNMSYDWKLEFVNNVNFDSTSFDHQGLRVAIMVWTWSRPTDESDQP